MSEFGWDAAGGGEDCAFSECVSERSQAVYGVRAALLFARLGVARASWFFASNIATAKLTGGSEPHLFSRSGLTASADNGFAPKQSLRAFEQLVRVLGDRRFVAVLREDAEVWAYAFGGADGTPSHVVAWRPVDGDDLTSHVAEVDLAALGGAYAPCGSSGLSTTVLSGAPSSPAPAPPSALGLSRWALAVDSAPTSYALCQASAARRLSPTEAATALPC